MYKIILLIKV